jgi:hypothetical protein
MKGVVMWGLAAALAAVHAFWLWDQLPPRVILHLNLWGKPDGWGSPDVWLGVYLGVVLLVAATFGAVDAALARGQTENLNVPHPDHWLAPVRRDASARFVRRSVRWFGLATLLLVALTMHVVGRASLAPVTPEHVRFWPLLLAYLIVTIVMVAAQLRRFPAPPSPPLDR